MSQPKNDRRIDYVELAVRDIEHAKRFYSGVFGWTFTEYGSEYAAFDDGRLQGGFHLRPDAAPATGNPLVIMYAVDLEAAERAVVQAGGVIVERHEFPGGRRFHFRDPLGNMLAVWMAVEG